MLRSIRLKPYKLHEDLTLENLPKISIVVGKNNTGKSSILHAAALPKYGVSWDPTIPTAPTSDTSLSARRLMEVQLNYGDDSRVAIEGSIIAPGQLSLRTTVGNGGSSLSNVSIPSENERRAPTMLRGPPGESQAVFYLGAYRASPTRSFQYSRFSRDVGPDGSDCWNALAQLHADDDPIFLEVTEAISRLGLGARRMGTPTANPGYGMLRVESFGRSEELPFLGSGNASVLPVVTQASLCVPGETFLVEEPELHLHRGAMGALWAHFARVASRGVQVIATTHSTEFFTAFLRAVDDGGLPADSALWLLDRTDAGKTTVHRQPTGFFEGAVDAMDAVTAILNRP